MTAENIKNGESLYIFSCINSINRACWKSQQPHLFYFLPSSRAGFYFLTQACLLSADFVDLRFATIDSGVSAISGLRRFTLRYNWLQPQKVNQKDLRCREMAKIETACLNPANALHDLLRGLFNGNQSQFDSGIFYFKGIKELTFLWGCFSLLRWFFNRYKDIVPNNQTRLH